MFTWLLSLLLSLSIFGGTDQGGTTSSSSAHQPTASSDVFNADGDRQETIIVQDVVIK